MSWHIPAAYWKITTAPFALVGACAVLISIAVLIKTAVFKVTSISTTGTIERVESRSGRSVQYVPVYSFRDDSGKSRQHEGILCGPDRWHPGEQVRVRYDPRDPDRSALDCFHDIWMVPLLFSAFSGAYLFVAWRVFRSSSGPGGPRIWNGS